MRVHPIWIARLNPIADEAGPRSAERDQLVRIDGQVGGGPGWVGRAILDEVAAHPVVPASGKVLHSLAEDVAVQLHPALARRPDETDGDARLIRLSHDSGLPVARQALDTHLLRIHH